MKLTDDAVRVLYRVYLFTLTVQSNMARTYSPEVGMLASMGFISTKEGVLTYGRHWRCTEDGLKYLRENNLI